MRVIRDYREGTDTAMLYLPSGLYHNHLMRYLSLLRHDQLLLCLYDDLCDAMIVLRQIFGFLGVAEGFIPIPRSNIIPPGSRAVGFSTG